MLNPCWLTRDEMCVLEGFSFFGLKSLLTPRIRLFLIEVFGVLIKISYSKLCGIQILKLLQMSELQGIQNFYNFTCQLQLQKSMFIFPSSNIISLVLYKLVNIRMARLISLIVILYPADTKLFFLTTEITVG